MPERYTRRLASFESFAPEEQRRRALALIQRAVSRAYNATPYYKQTFDALGVDPRDLDRLEDIVYFPLLDKADVLENEKEFIATGRDGALAHWDATGGSTGVPLRFLRSRHAESMTYANERRCWRWYGVRPGARQAYIWGADRDISPTQSAMGWKGRLLGTCQLNAFQIDHDRCRTFADILDRFRPEIVYGYATALARFAAYARDSRRALQIRPKAVRSTAEVLLPEHRALIEEHLHAPVYDYCGAREVGPIAGECSAHQGMHVFPDVNHIEVVRPDGTPCEPGEMGAIVVTKLHEFAMPFIRYRTGDRAAWLRGDCVCGIPFPRLASIEGRIGDFVRAPDGREIHGEYFTHLFYGVRGVSRFQVRQPTPDTLRILVQASGTPDAEALEGIRRASAEHFGALHPSSVTLEVVDFIRPGASGKHRFVIPYAAAAQDGPVEPDRS